MVNASRGSHRIVLHQDGARTLSFLVAIAIFLTLRADAQNNGVVYQIPASEYSALVDLYNQAGGAGWTYQSGWLDPNATSWRGVNIGGVQYGTNGNVVVQGNVQYLNLGWNQLSGSIPASLGNLTQLQYLDLEVNQLSGSIPASLGNLTQLQYLDLGDNQLSGGIPASLGNLTQLQHLGLGDNQLSGSILASLGNLTQLQYLNLGDNHLSGSIPASLGNLTQLQTLNLEDNHLSGSIPVSLGNLTQLQYLNLGQYLNPGDNQLSGSIPESLGNLTQLQYLHLEGGQLSGSIPASLGNLTQLQELHLEGNQLSGSIPESLGNLTQLQELYLDDNQLSGSIPASLGNLTQLWYWLGLEGNQLSGSIPTSLGNLTQLLYLHLEGNQLSGSIPTSLGNLTQLQCLGLEDNQLVGDVPIFSGPLSWFGAYLWNNCLEISPGTQSRANIDFMISTGRHVYYSPQSTGCQAATIQFVDPNPSLLDANGNLISDVDWLSVGGSVITGVAADGVTLVLLRMPSDNPVTFSLASGDPADGGLSQLGNVGLGAGSVTVSPVPDSLGSNWVFAVYIPPTDFTASFTTNASRLIQFQATGGSGTVTQNLTLVRPPVVLVHGIWDHPIEAWVHTGFADYLRSAGFTVEWADYGANNGAGFDPYRSFNWPVLRVAEAIKLAKLDLTTTGIAVTEVDVVGHSMGGLVTRSYAEGANYRNSANFWAGDIHKLITIGTPHLGSCLANFLEAYLGNGTIAWFSAHGHPIGDGVNDLQVNSPALQHVGQTPFMGYAIAGNVDTLPYYTATENAFNTLIWMVNPFYPSSVRSLLGNSNDTIVPVGSQQGLLAGLQTATIPGIVHIDVGVATVGINIDLGETASPDVQGKVLQMLFEPFASGEFDYFPPPLKFFSVGSNAQCPLNPAVAAQSVGSSAVRPNTQDPSLPGVLILSPTNGAVLNPGSTVTLSATAINGVTFTNVMFFVPPILMIPVAGPPFQTSFTLSSNLVGTANIAILAVDNSGNVYTSSVTVNIQPTASLTFDPD